MSDLSDVLIGEEMSSAPLRRLFFARSVRPQGAASGPSFDREFASGYVRGPLDHAVVIAVNPATEPEILARFAADRRVSVRTALMVNPSTPDDVREDLVVWSLGRGSNDDPVDRAVAMLPAPAVARVSRTGGARIRLNRTQARKVAMALASDPEALSACDVESLGSLPGELALLAVSGSFPRLSVRSVFDRISSEYLRGRVMYQLLEAGVPLTVELVEAWEASGMSEHDARSVPLSVPPLVQEEALELLSSGPPSRLRLAVIAGLPEREILARLGSTGALVDFDAVVSALRRTDLGRSFELGMVRAFLAHHAVDDEVPQEHGGVAHMVHRMLGTLRHPLPDDEMVALIRSGSVASTAAWLSGEVAPVRYYRQPTPVQVGCTASAFARVVSDPGCALRSVESVPLRGRQIVSEPRWVDLVESLLTRAALDPEFSSPVVETLGEELRPSALRSSPKALYPYVRSRLGEDVPAWELFLSLFDTWAGGLKGLTEAALRLSAARS